MTELKAQHTDLLVDILAKSAENPLLDSPKEFFRDLVLSANLPSGSYGQVAGKLSGDPSMDARKLVLWADFRGEIANEQRSTLGALLLAFLQKNPPIDDARSAAAILLSYGLVKDS